MVQHKILKHLAALFFVLALLTVFAMQWNTAKDTRHLMMDRPMLGPEEIQRTLERPGQEKEQRETSRQK